MKLCPTCEQEKELTEFYSTVKKDGRVYYRRECKNCVRIRNRQWKRDNPEKHAGHRITFEAKPERIKYLKENTIRQKESGYFLEWQQNNPDKTKDYTNQHNDHNITTKEWNLCKAYFNNQCAYCGISINEHYGVYRGITSLHDFHRDHVIHDGEGTLNNCVPSCKSCNCSKHTASLELWYNKENPNYTLERKNKIIQWLMEDYKYYIK